MGPAPPSSPQGWGPPPDLLAFPSYLKGVGRDGGETKIKGQPGAVLEKLAATAQEGVNVP